METITKPKLTADKKQYMKEYRQNHPECWKPQNTCSFCNVTYNASITLHNRTKKHKINQMICQYNELEKSISSIKNTISF